MHASASPISKQEGETMKIRPRTILVLILAAGLYATTSASSFHSRVQNERSLALSHAKPSLTVRLLPGVAQANNTVNLAGLHGRVTVRRDERGIPYIEATNDEDLYFAQGYLTASDRLWQMDILRRTVRGELSEIFGRLALAQDKSHRVFGFAGILDQTAAHLPANLSLALNAYAKGVNAYIDSRTDQNLPPEFVILQYKPRPWIPADSLAVGKLLAEYLSTSWQLDIMRASMATLPKEKREALFPETSPLDVLVVGSDRPSLKTTNRREAKSLPECLLPSRQVLTELNELIESQRQSLEGLGLFTQPTESIQASNNWVVSGKRTVSGRPLLANDPHIPAAAPGIWYQTELAAPGIHVAGVTFPGAPGIVLGHNERIAWGATNLLPDVQDVYVEKFDKDNPQRYLTPSGWRDAEIRHEQIKVRRSFIDAATETQTFDVTVTRHGPIILEKDSTRYALRWPALDPASFESAGLFDANRARNWKEFTEALSHYGGPTQNFVYVDVDGHIGYYGAGRVPIRKTGDGSLPYDGSTDDGEWIAYIPFDKLPHAYDPPSGMIVTANQRVVGQDYPYFLTHAWISPYRARRIFNLLSEKPKLTTDDFRRIQGDVYSIAGVTFARAAARTLKSGAGAATDEKLHNLVTSLENWDGMMTADSRVAPVVVELRSAFSRRILNAALGPELAKNYGWLESDVFVDHIVSDQPGEWLPKEFKTYADLLIACYDDARQALTNTIDADESKWLWGNVARARFPHLLSNVPLIGLQFTIPPFPQNGAGGAVNVGASVSVRLIAEPGDWDKSLNGIPLGESGLPNSPHWKDQLDDWRNVAPRALPFSKAAVENATKELLVLEPAPK
jgi:penicillin amidase